MKRYLAMPDLSRTPGSPLYEIVERTKKLPVVKDFDNIIIPEIVPADISFDLFNFAPDHPARSTSDTYYVDTKNILRTHDTVMWYYYLQLPEIKKKIAEKKSLGVICYGKVYRKDEIDRSHMNIFHQMGGLLLMPDEKKLFVLDDLKNVLSEIVKSIFGKDVVFRFNTDTFPYTDPSLELEVELNGKWLEVLGGGMPRKSVLKTSVSKDTTVGRSVSVSNAWLSSEWNFPTSASVWSKDERVKTIEAWDKIRPGQQIPVGHPRYFLCRRFNIRSEQLFRSRKRYCWRSRRRSGFSRYL